MARAASSHRTVFFVQPHAADRSVRPPPHPLHSPLTLSLHAPSNVPTKIGAFSQLTELSLPPADPATQTPHNSGARGRSLGRFGRTELHCSVPTSSSSLVTVTVFLISAPLRPAAVRHPRGPHSRHSFWLSLPSLPLRIAALIHATPLPHPPTSGVVNGENA